MYICIGIDIDERKRQRCACLPCATNITYTHMYVCVKFMHIFKISL